MTSFSLREAFKLNEAEIFITLFKYSFTMSIFNKPYIYNQFGVTRTILCEVIALGIVIMSNLNLISCLKFLPGAMT